MNEPEHSVHRLRFALPGGALVFLWVTLAGCEPDFEAPHLQPPEAANAQTRVTSEWQHYGGDGGTKYVEAEVIDKRNVEALEMAWIYRTGDVSTIFQSSPILVDGQLVFCTPYNRVIALDPLNGAQLWSYDAQIDREIRVANGFNCRGVAQWQGSGLADGDACATRIFMATNDARLIAIDAANGRRCADFGDTGEVHLGEGVGKLEHLGEYQVTSPPTVVGDVVVVGSAITDGSRVDAPSGVVRGYDARDGSLRWAFDLAPPNFDYSSRPVSSAGYALGTPNVWSAMSADDERDLVFLPTGNPSPDYDRTHNNDLSHYGSSVIALKGSTGEVVWHFATVLNDLWDFDVPSQPVLVDLNLGDQQVPALVQATKMGFIFVLHRETGEPLVDVTYESVPTHGPLAAQLSSVQPFVPPAFRTSRSYSAGSSLLGLCSGMDEESVIGPIYTPITEQWTVGLPSNMGATNWGGVAVDPVAGRIVVHTNSVPFRTKLINREEAADLLSVMESAEATPAQRTQARETFMARYNLPPSTELARQLGAAHLMARHTYLDPYLGAPCAGLPMAEMMVIDIASQSQVWRRPHGTLIDFAMLPLNWGVPGVGGPLVTSTGLIFIGGAAENAIRAYDAQNGAELWRHRLPHPGHANPVSYTVETDAGPRQFVIVAAGGDQRTGIGGVGDYLVAFSLPQ